MSSSVKQLIESKDVIKFIEINQSLVDKKSRLNNSNTFTLQWNSDKENIVNGTEARVASPVKQPLEPVVFIEYKKTSPVKSHADSVVSYGPSMVLPLSPAQPAAAVALSSPASSRYENLAEVKRALFTDANPVKEADPLFDEDMRLDVVPQPVSQSPPVRITSPVKREARDRPLTPLKSPPRASPHKVRQSPVRTPPRVMQSTPQHAPFSPNLSQDLYLTPSESFSPSKLSASLYYSFTTQTDDNDLILIESSTEANPSPRRSIKKKRTPVRRVLSSPGTKRSLSTMMEETDTPYAQQKKRRALAPLTASQVNAPLTRPEPSCHTPTPAVTAHQISLNNEQTPITDLWRKGPVLRPRSNNVHWIDKVLHMVHYK